MGRGRWWSRTGWDRTNALRIKCVEAAAPAASLARGTSAWKAAVSCWSSGRCVAELGPTKAAMPRLDTGDRKALVAAVVAVEE